MLRVADADIRLVPILACARAAALVLLAAIALDLADGDCPKGAWGVPATGACAEAETLLSGPDGGCACCIFGEVAASAADPGAPDVRPAAVRLASLRTCRGFRPAPYRPPLPLS